MLEKTGPLVLMFTLSYDVFRCTAGFMALRLVSSVATQHLVRSVSVCVCVCVRVCVSVCA